MRQGLTFFFSRLNNLCQTQDYHLIHAICLCSSTLSNDALGGGLFPCKQDANGRKGTKTGSTVGFWLWQWVVVAGNCKQQSWGVFILWRDHSVLELLRRRRKWDKRARREMTVARHNIAARSTEKMSRTCLSPVLDQNRTHSHATGIDMGAGI